MVLGFEVHQIRITPGASDETVVREPANLGNMKVREYIEGKQDWIQARFPIGGERPDEDGG